MTSKVRELFGRATDDNTVDWKKVVRSQHCLLLGRKCRKTRKSAPNVAIGTCTVRYGAAAQDVIICPLRLLERRQVFTDCLHLLTLHTPGNELHVVQELTVPGGSVDYCLVSVRGGKAVDFVGIELQSLDTTGTVWPERQGFLRGCGLRVQEAEADARAFGMNWKMTAKTTLVQLHHKIGTFESVGRHLVLVIQDCLLDYMRRQFQFDHLDQARVGDPMHLHSYSLVADGPELRLALAERLSTDTNGIARCLGLQATTRVDVQAILDQLQSKLSRDTLLAVG